NSTAVTPSRFLPNRRNRPTRGRSAAESVSDASIENYVQVPAHRRHDGPEHRYRKFVSHYPERRNLGRSLTCSQPNLGIGSLPSRRRALAGALLALPLRHARALTDGTGDGVEILGAITDPQRGLAERRAGIGLAADAAIDGDDPLLR